MARGCYLERLCDRNDVIENNCEVTWGCFIEALCDADDVNVGRGT